MTTVEVRTIRSNPGFEGSEPQGTVTVTVVVRSPELDRFELDVRVPDRGDPGLNLEDARAVLQRVSQGLVEALKRPLTNE
jgi:hypothetical protein